MTIASSDSGNDVESASDDRAEAERDRAERRSAAGATGRWNAMDSAATVEPTPDAAMRKP